MCATTDCSTLWGSIDFSKAEKHVKKLQNRIVLAWESNNLQKVQFLQNQLIHSFYAKALAVRIVTTNVGKKTPGADGICWTTSEDKWKAISELSRRGYQMKPLLRIDIPKNSGGTRPLRIPCMIDRAMQTLFKFTLEPIAEATGDIHSYGFRNGRSTRNAIFRCIDVLSSEKKPQWILEGDIESCFDSICHQWILDNIPMDKVILSKFLKCHCLEYGNCLPTENGVPQGGALSPVICNMTLDGLEETLKRKYSDSIEFIRYADDFVIISNDKCLIESSVIHTIEAFLSHRGLQLSSKKTKVTHIQDGFDFLGWNLQCLSGNLVVKPTLKNYHSMIDRVSEILDSLYEQSEDYAHHQLSLYLSGWISYHQGVIDEDIYCSIIDEITFLIYNRTQDDAFAGSFMCSSQPQTSRTPGSGVLTN